MNLDDIPNGAAVLLDANIIIHAKRSMSVQCRRLLARCGKGEVRGFITAIAVAEFCDRRMMQEAQSLGLVASNPARSLGQNRMLLGRLSQYRQDVEDLLAGDLTVLRIEAADLLGAIVFQGQHGLLTNDSLHLATALHAGIQLIASSDAHFQGIPGVTLYQPTDLPS